MILKGQNQFYKRKMLPFSFLNVGFRIFGVANDSEKADGIYIKNNIPSNLDGAIYKNFSWIFVVSSLLTVIKISFEAAVNHDFQ